MDSYNSDMKIPTRPAPGLPVNRINKNSCVENSANDPFGLFKSRSIQQDKRKPPPRPPPPKSSASQQSNQRRSTFGSIIKKQPKPPATAIVKPLPPASNIPVGTLIDLQSPPSSPQFPSKLRSSLSVGNIASFINNPSLIESGFEDDFSSILSSNATTPGFDPWSTNSDFTPSSSKTPSPDLIALQKSIKNELMKNKNFKQMSKSQNISKPTIICVPSSNNSSYKVKPNRPPPPSNSALCNSNQFVNNSTFLNKEGSPPMPCVPPPPPPPEAFSTSNINVPDVPPRPAVKVDSGEKQPFCVAQYDYDSNHPEDLNFKTGDKIIIVNEVNDEWLLGRYLNKEGMFPKSYVKIIVPLFEPIQSSNMTVIAVNSFIPETWDDLELKEGDEIKVLYRINKDWLFGECDGKRGQFPECFTQDITDLNLDI